jgi:hypothetical protein
MVQLWQLQQQQRQQQLLQDDSGYAVLLCMHAPVCSNSNQVDRAAGWLAGSLVQQQSGSGSEGSSRAAAAAKAAAVVVICCDQTRHQQPLQSYTRGVVRRVRSRCSRCYGTVQACCGSWVGSLWRLSI